MALGRLADRFLKYTADPLPFGYADALRCLAKLGIQLRRYQDL